MLSMRFEISSEMKEALLLLAFSFLMREYLTWATIGFVCLGSVLVVVKRRPNNIVRNVLALGIFGSYWISYGKVIDPEVGLNFLTTVTVLKLLEKETLRDRFMLFFGLLLIISAGSLFEKTLSYVLFFCFSFFVLIQDFYKSIGAKWRVGELLKAVVWVIPITAFLFFLAPRAMSPLPFQQGAPQAGEVGYTSNVNISQVESLSGNDSPVFEVQVSKKIPQEQLYWRGNAITFTDGWNWVLLNRSNPQQSESEADLTVTSEDEILQDFHSDTREEYFFSLDHPTMIRAKDKNFIMSGSKSFPHIRNSWSPRYRAISSMKGGFPFEGDTREFTRLPMKRDMRKWIEKNFPGKTPTEVINQVREYFLKNGFTYSLSPGKIENFREFMSVKRTGFCSHYASALGLILRAKKIPARLVSGFMGGEYNKYADYYEVKQNDAHVWVEVVQDNQWVRVDPTGWMAPTRLILGGEGYMTSTSDKRFNLLSQFGWYYEARMWFEQWDFVVYQWLEDMDYTFQERWLEKLKLKRQWLYSLAVLTIVFFMGLYAWSLNRAQNRNRFSFHQELWQLFIEKVEARGLTLSPVSLEETRLHLEAFSHKDRDTLLSLWDQLVRLSFSHFDENEGKNLMTQINRL